MVALKSKAFDTQDALVTALKANTALSAWRIDFGIPAGRPEEQHIWVDEEVADWSQELGTTGIVTRNEAFRLYIYVYDKRTGSDAKEVRDEVKLAADAISETLATTPFLGGVVLYAEITGGAYEGAFADSEGRAREGLLKLSIDCQAFLA